jgi:hypothetical protein
MQSPIPIIVMDALPVKKGAGSSSDDSADGFRYNFIPISVNAT